MKKLQMSYSKFLVTIFCLPLMHVAHSAQPTSQQCEDMLQVTVTDMDFGSYVGGTSGTIVMDATGAMVHTGVVPVGGTVGVTATYDLVAPGKNCDKKKFLFTMPASITISNISGAPATTLIITNLVNNLIKNPFQVQKVNQIKIGGTLTVTSGDAQAPYSGPFDVSFTVQ